MFGPRRDVRTVQPNRAAVDEKSAGNGSEQRRLSGSIRADDDDERSLVDGQVDAAKGAHFVRRRSVEGLEDAADLEHRYVSWTARVLVLGLFSRRPSPGSTRATKTNTAVTSLRSLGSRPPRSASATIRRNSTEPMTAPMITNPRSRTPTSASPMITLASPHTT